MARSSGTYTAPTNSFNPAVEGTEIDEGDWNTLLDDLEAAITESTYTAGLGSTDNRLARTDGTDGKKLQGSAISVDDSGNLSGIGYIDQAETAAPGSPAANTLRLYTADDGSGNTRLYAKDSAGTVYTLTTTASAILDAIGSTRGMILYRGASGWSVLSPGSSGQVLQTSGAGADPAWASVAGTGDVTAASAFGTDNRVVRSDGTSKGVQASAVSIDDSGNMSGIFALTTSGTVTVGTTASTAPLVDPSGFIQLPEVSAPSTPSSGFLRLYVKSDGKPYAKNDAGTETDLSQTVGSTSTAPNGQHIHNLNVTASVAASALTVELKTNAGTDPSPSDPIVIAFRSPTAATGTYTTVSIEAAISLTISSGSTLGTSNSVPFPLWLVCFNDAGTARLGIINTVSGTNVFQLGAYGIASSTAEGGAGGADSAHTFYTGTAVTSKAYTVLARLSWTSGLATAGAWSSGPSRLQLMDGALRLPGDVVQVIESGTVSMTTGSTLIPADDTIPQSTEGNQYFSQAITPVSASHVLRFSSAVNGSLSTGSNALVMALFKDSDANALAASWQNGVAAGAFFGCVFNYAMLSGTTSSTTFKIRAGPISAGTYTLNGVGGARFMGGVAYSNFQITEIAT